MDPSRVSRILEDWSAVAHEARRPAAPPRGMVFRSGLAGTTLASAGLVVAALVIAGVLLSRQGPNVVVGSSPSPQESVKSTPAPSPSGSSCQPEDVDARITGWEGAAGSRIADVELTNTTSTPCDLETMAKPQLVGGRGDILIEGAAPTRIAILTLATGDVVKTLVRTSNYCGPAPEPPVSVVFVTSYEAGFVATPVSATDATLPPCNGAPGSPGDIEMQPWAP